MLTIIRNMTRKQQPNKTRRTVSLTRRRRYANRSRRSKCKGLGKKSCRRKPYCIRAKGKKRRYCRRRHSRPHN